MDFRRAQQQAEISLSEAARGYFATGMRDFHDVRISVHRPFQVTFGVLAISVELMLKALIVKKAPILLFEGLPLELQVKALYPVGQHGSELNRVEEMGLTHFGFRTVELDKCIGIFYVLFPEEKQNFKAPFDLLSVNRNAAVHAVIQGFQRYDLERVAYLSIRLCKLLQAQKVHGFFHSQLSKADETFIQLYDSERNERVKKEVAKAREQSKRSEGRTLHMLQHDWGRIVHDCPVCGSEGLMDGYCDMQWDYVDGDDRLIFYGEEFGCQHCGLKLKDASEIELAGIPNSIEREGEQDRWITEFGYPEPPFLNEQD